MLIKLKFHSIVDVITNSSTVIFTYQNSTTQAKELIAEVLRMARSDKTPDDVFYYGVFCEKSQYLEDLDDEDMPDEMPKMTAEYRTDEREEQHKALGEWFDALFESIIKGEIEAPEWMGKQETNYDNYAYDTYLHLIPKSDEFNELGKSIQKLLGSVSGDGYRDG